MTNHLRRPLETGAPLEAPLEADDRRLVDRIERELRPGEGDRLREALFLQAVEAKLERRTPRRLVGSLAVLATAAALAGFWLATPGAPVPAPVPVEVASAAPEPGEGDDVISQPVLAADAVAAVESDDDVDPSDYLPGEFLVLASDLDEDVADL